MNRSRDLSGGTYLTDDSSQTGLDVFRHADNTAPPPNLGHSGQSGKDQPTIWSYYSQRGEHYDKDLVDDANTTVEVLLIFAGLFSAVVTAFISQTYPMLQPDPKDILTSIYFELRNPGTNTTLDEPFVVPPYAVRVNCFLFAGLFTSMLVALLAILVKQWTRSYQQELAGVSSPHLRARIRHFRFNGAKRWHLASTVGLLSIFMHLALFISSVGIIDLLLATAPTVGYVALAVFLLGLTFFLATTLLPLFVLDAPFRSPLSKLLSGMKRRVEHFRLPHIHNIRSKKLNEEEGPSKDKEGLEDHIEQSQGRESDENSIVRTRIDLDLEIICHLLSTADKSTERWLLDLCFEKLPELKLLEQQDPHCFHTREIIVEVYNFLTKGCIMTNKKGDEEVNSDRLPRARQLCRFLAWYLALPRKEEERRKLNQKLEKGGDPAVLPRLLAEDEALPSIIAARTALGHIEHFKQPRSEGSCSICRLDAKELEATWANVEPAEPREEEKVRKVTAQLIKRTECLIATDRNNTLPGEKAKAECSDSLKALQQALQKCNPIEKEKKLWAHFLTEKERGASKSLKEAWFMPLSATVEGIQIARRPSPLPFRPVDGTSPPGSNGTLQLPRVAIGLPGSRSPPFLRTPTNSGYSSGGSPGASPNASLSRPPSLPFNIQPPQ